jgi:tRNA threonylcarbamoyladenosine biosynthesis protein TsaE
MSTELTWQTESTSSEATFQLGEQIGRNLRGGELIELNGDLGSGKTALVKGIAAGMGSNDTVHSPSFTLSNEYKGHNLTLYHFDFYRLNEPGIMRREISEVLEDPKKVVVVEWPGIVEDVLPGNRLNIKFRTISENKRILEFSGPDKYGYLIKGAKT